MTHGFPEYLTEGKLGQVPAYVLIPQLPEGQTQNRNARVTVFPKTDHVGVPQCAWLEHGTELLDWLFS